MVFMLILGLSIYWKFSRQQEFVADIGGDAILLSDGAFSAELVWRRLMTL